jgi:uncharacterized membrane protein YphA (DoxX/SURF4 family)
LLFEQFAVKIGRLGLIVGFLERIGAFDIICNMVVAIAMVHESRFPWIGPSRRNARRKQDGPRF